MRPSFPDQQMAFSSGSNKHALCFSSSSRINLSLHFTPRFWSVGGRDRLRDPKTLASESSLKRTHTRLCAVPPVSLSLLSFTLLQAFAHVAHCLEHSFFPASLDLILKVPSSGRPSLSAPMLSYTLSHLNIWSHFIIVTGVISIFKSSHYKSKKAEATPFCLPLYPHCPVDCLVSTRYSMTPE